MLGAAPRRRVLGSANCKGPNRLAVNSRVVPRARRAQSRDMLWNTGAVFPRNSTFGLPARWIVAVVLSVLALLLTAAALSQRYGSACEGSSLDAAIVCPPPAQRLIVPRPLPGHAPTPRIAFEATTA